MTLLRGCLYPGCMPSLSTWFQRLGLADRPWLIDARCGNHQDLPWAADTKPDVEQWAEMFSVCSQCPVVASCARYGLTADGGFYAGVWIPWKGTGGESDNTKYLRRRGRNELKRIAETQRLSIPA